MIVKLFFFLCQTRRNLELLCRYIGARSDMTDKRSGATTPWHIREICG